MQLFSVFCTMHVNTWTTSLHVHALYFSALSINCTYRPTLSELFTSIVRSVCMICRFVTADLQWLIVQNINYISIYPPTVDYV